MKPRIGIWLLAAMSLVLVAAFAYAASDHSAGPSKTVTGEVVDLGCYLGHNGKGAAHKECAVKCVQNGGPMGLLTDKGVLYVLTMSHDNPDPYNKTKEYAGAKVKITGPSMTKNATKAIQVEAVQTI